MSANSDCQARHADALKSSPLRVLLAVLNSDTFGFALGYLKFAFSEKNNMPQNLLARCAIGSFGLLIALARCSADDEILTPKPPATPRINGATIFGVRPGHPVLFTIAATGDRPMQF